MMCIYIHKHTYICIFPLPFLLFSRHLRKYSYRNPVNRDYKNIMFLLPFIPSSGKQTLKLSLLAYWALEFFFQADKRYCSNRADVQVQKSILHEEAFLSLWNKNTLVSDKCAQIPYLSWSTSVMLIATCRCSLDRITQGSIQQHTAVTNNCRMTSKISEWCCTRSKVMIK